MTPIGNFKAFMIILYLCQGAIKDVTLYISKDVQI